MDTSTNSVIISTTRLAELEALEASIPFLLEKARHEYDTERLTMLRERQKKNPERHNKHVLETYHKNKEVINARRRAAYKAKKDAAAAASVAPAGDVLSS